MGTYGDLHNPPEGYGLCRNCGARENTEKSCELCPTNNPETAQVFRDLLEIKNKEYKELQNKHIALLHNKQ